MSTLAERARQAATNSLNARRDTDLGSNAELLNELADEIERLQRELNAANDRFAQMNTVTGREIELIQELKSRRW